MSGKKRVLFMSKQVFSDVSATIGNAPAETGGMLGMRNGIISDFYFDKTADVNFRQYSPDSAACSRILNGEWYPNGIRFCGFVHSHAVDPLPSESDTQYMQKICAAVTSADGPAPADIYLLIAQAPQSEFFSLHSYLVQDDLTGDFRLVPIPLEICL